MNNNLKQICELSGMNYEDFERRIGIHRAEEEASETSRQIRLKEEDKYLKFYTKKYKN